MELHKVLMLVVGLIVLLVRIARSRPAPPKAETKKTGRIKVGFPDGWQDMTAKSAYDIYREDAAASLVTGIFRYSREDIATDAEPEDLLLFTTKDLMGKRERPEFIEQVQDLREGDKRTLCELYGADFNGQRTYYLLSLVEYDEYDEFLVFVQTCFPSDWKDKAKPVLLGIVNSAKITP